MRLIGQSQQTQLFKPNTVTLLKTKQTRLRGLLDPQELR
jgi:hypothetical protein